MQKSIRPAYHHDVSGGVLFRLSRPLVTFDIFSKVLHPTQKAHQTVSI